METIMETLLSYVILGFVIYGLVGGWRLYKQRLLEEQQNFSPPQQEPQDKTLLSYLLWFECGRTGNHHHHHNEQ